MGKNPYRDFSNSAFEIAAAIAWIGFFELGDATGAAAQTGAHFEMRDAHAWIHIFNDDDSNP